MKPTVVITIITAVLAVAAGVAIAGLPSSTPGADVRVLEVPTVETRPTPTVPEVTVQPLESTTTTSISEATTTSEAATTTTSALPEPTAPTTAVDTTPDTTPDTTAAPVTTTTEPDGAPADELRDRDELSVAAANATDRSGVAGDHVDILAFIGYVDVTPIDAEASATSAVYYQPGFELEAARMAADLDWDLLGLAPMAEIPTLLTDRTFELVALVGLDRT